MDKNLNQWNGEYKWMVSLEPISNGGIAMEEKVTVVGRTKIRESQSRRRLLA